MSLLATDLVKRLAATTEPLDPDDPSLLLAREIIAKVRMSGFEPCDSRVASEDFDDEDVLALRDALVDYALRFPDDPTRGTAYWGLAALHDPNELDLLRGILKTESTKELLDEEVLWQVMIGLDNIGEDILKPIQSDPVEQAGDRWAASRLYLERNP